MSIENLIQGLLELPNCNPTLSKAYLVNRNDIVDVIDEYKESHHSLSPRSNEKGSWLYNSYEHCYVCSNCLHENIHNYNFCPRCGADMR